MWYKQKCSVYNVHVCKKREQEAMKVGIEFGSTPLSQTRPTVWLNLAFIRITKWNYWFRIGVWKHTGHFLFLLFAAKEKNNASLNCQSVSRRRHGGVFLVDDWLCIGIQWTWGRNSDFHLPLSATLSLRVFGFAPRHLNRSMSSLYLRNCKIWITQMLKTVD